MTFILAGPVSSGGQMGRSPFFTGLVILVGAYVLTVSIWEGSSPRL